MKNIYEVLRQKEAEVAHLQQELEALRIAARLLADDNETRGEAVRFTPARATAGQAGDAALAAPGTGPVPAPQPVIVKDQAPAWPAGVRQFP